MWLAFASELLTRIRNLPGKCGAPFRLLVDEDAKIAKKFGVWQMKTFMGKKYRGIVRTTFVIDEKGKIEKTFPKVKVVGHWKEVLAGL